MALKYCLEFMYKCDKYMKIILVIKVFLSIVETNN